MFGLPAGTTWMVFGFPLFWIGYLVVFMLLTRNWNKDASAEDDST